jgi:nitroreductase
MNVLQAIRERRAVRDYKPEPVSAGMIYQLISSASWAPSAMNEQPCHFTVVTDTGLLDEISVKAKAWLLKNVWSMPRSALFRDLLKDEKFHLLYQAPALILVSAPSWDQWVIEDCALAAQNMMLTATYLGLGTCWIGFAQGWLNTAEGRALLDLSGQNLCVAPIVVGHPKAVLPPVERKPPVITWVGSAHHLQASVHQTGVARQHEG